MNYIKSSMMAIFVASLLIACGGGGGSSSETGSSTDEATPTNAINLMLATNPNDTYFATVQSGDETLVLFADSDSAGDLGDTLVYNNSAEQVIFVRTDEATRYDRMLINGYQFDSTLTESGAEILVTMPSGEQETYYVDVDGQLIGGGDDNNAANENNDIVETTSCIAVPTTGVDASYCMNLAPALYPASYCNSDFLNNEAGGNGIIASVSYSTSSLCAERGYPYKLASSNDNEGWSAWFSSPIADSASAFSTNRSVTSNFFYNTEECDAGMYSDKYTWDLCSQHHGTVMSVVTQGIVFEIFRDLIEMHFSELFDAFEKSQKFIADIRSKGLFDAIIATSILYPADTIEEIAELVSSMAESLNEVFDDINNGIAADNYSGVAPSTEIYNSSKGPISESTDPDADSDVGTDTGTDTSTDTDAGTDSSEIFPISTDYLWEQASSTSGQYPLRNELHFFSEGYFLRYGWRLNTNSQQQENGFITSGAWKQVGNKVITQEYNWYLGNRTSYNEVEYSFANNNMKRISNKRYNFEGNPSFATEVINETLIKINWIKSDGKGPQKFNDYLTGEFSEYIGESTKLQLNTQHAIEQATTPTSWKDNESIQPWVER